MRGEDVSRKKKQVFLLSQVRCKDCSNEECIGGTKNKRLNWCNYGGTVLTYSYYELMIKIT